MITFLRGRIAQLTGEGVVVDVGGVGYTVQCAPATLAQLAVGDDAMLPTSMVVREDSMTLYGFVDDDERVLFELVQTASGVGPRVAQAMLATLTPEELRRAIAAEDWAALTAVSGIGKKGAQRICLELRDRISAPTLQLPGQATRGATPAPDPWREQVTSALLGLGWSSKEADEAVAAVAPEAERALAVDGRVEIPVLLRAALATLARAEARA